MIRIEWATEVGVLAAFEPTRDELVAHAPALAAAYNDPHNADLMGHTAAIAPAEVVAHYIESIAGGMRAFLLEVGREAELAGDADLRGIAGGAAEFAFMIAARTAQGRGLGTRFAIMIHAFGFAQLELERIYPSVVPRNTASLRVFEKLGYTVDDRPAARAYADEPEDVVLALDRHTFVTRHRQPLEQIRIAMR